MKGAPITAATAVTYPGTPPASADVVIIGGGIIGVMTAWELARKGLRAVIVEKGRVAGEQSSRNWGWIRAQGRDPAELPIMMEGRGIWRDLLPELDADIGLQQTGTLYLAAKQAEIAGYEDWMPHAKANGLDSEILTSVQVAAKLPASAVTWAGALWTPSDMRAEPWVTVPTLARAAVRAGVAIVENCAARMIDVAAGKVAGVVTEAGMIKAPAVVVAGGAWSSLLLRRHGIKIPQLSVRATVAATALVGDVYQGGAVDDRLAFRRRADGGYTLAPSGFHELYIGPDAFRALRGYSRALMADPLGTRYLPAAPKGFPDAWGTKRGWGPSDVTPFETMRVLDPAPNRAKVAKLARDFAATFPGQGDVKIAAAWAGMIDTMPDVVPVVDTAASLPGLTICTGMCGHGFGIGPAFGRITAKLVTQEAPGHDIARFRLSRFFDGSKLVLGPNL